MLLVEITINATLNRVSILGHALTNNWKPYIIAFDNPIMAPNTDYGGFCHLRFGAIYFSPELFASDWPPPVSCPIAIYYTATTEAARELIFDGTAHRQNFNREEVV